MRYINYILGQLRILLLVLWSALWVYRVKVYPNRLKLWENRNLPNSKKAWYWKYADTYETKFGSDYNNFLNSFYGLYELLNIWSEVEQKYVADYEAFYLLNEKQKKKLSYKWGVWRNGWWNGIISEAPEDLPKLNLKVIKNTGGSGKLRFRNKKYHGWQWITWNDKNGDKFFRFSFTTKFIFGKHINFQSGTGASGNRNTFKLRIFKYNQN